MSFYPTLKKEKNGSFQHLLLPFHKVLWIMKNDRLRSFIVWTPVNDIHRKKA